MATFTKKGLTPKTENISEWYHDLVVLGDLADYSSVKGCMIIKPHGYAIWERVQQYLDAKFKSVGVKNAYFPLFIPYSLLQKEQDHLEGFSPELAIVTHAGGEELSEPYVVRPTSETIMYQTFADWVQSYRDLPLLINQWCNVVRWEKRTYPFLRTSEFLWQEGHTVHKTADEAESMAQQALGWYKQFYEEVFAISPYVGVKSSSERFAGANQTYTIELVMADGKALQAATSHNLGDNFSKVFGIEYLDEANTKQHPFQTSWGLSTRAIGGLILVHGDDAGLVLPPKAAPIQVVVLAIQDKEETKRAAINSYAAGLAESLKAAGVLVELDTDNNQSFGSRINKWELKGVPVRLEIGGKEAESQQVTVVRRDTFTKETISSADIAHSVTTLLATMQADMLAKSLASKEALTKEAKNFDEFTSYLGDQKHFIRAFWCERPECEKEIKEATRATTRCLELEHVATHETAVCVRCDQPATRKWLFAQSY